MALKYISRFKIFSANRNKLYFISLVISYSVWLSQVSSDALSLLLAVRLSWLQADRSVLTSVHVTADDGTARFASTTHQHTPTHQPFFETLRPRHAVDHTGKM